ncbi:hypothetical protein [Methylobacterium sp. R2-1]|uniref:hypothetical protein n=1 Tax=Methylobacterium sp. R2-1 TaxID=2587064 RepID=UPI00184D396C|nr:hypothetical protein [Methylobacterium sp. R2-1]MBB2963380.1 hypothetical protein [Methylobacterium sp. R2-1]
MLLWIGQSVSNHLVGLEAWMLARDFAAGSRVTPLLDPGSEFHFEHQAIPRLGRLSGLGYAMRRTHGAGYGKGENGCPDHGSCLSGDLGTSMAKLAGVAPRSAIGLLPVSQTLGLDVMVKPKVLHAASQVRA